MRSVTLEHGRLFGLEATGLDGLVGKNAEAADAEAKQHPLDKGLEPREKRSHR